VPGSPQLPLSLPHAPSYSREDFVPGPSNSVALRLIESWPGWPSPVVLLTGPAGSGKTHLAQIWAANANAEVLRADALAIEQIVPRIEAGRSFVVEDVAPHAVPAAALFHLINAVRELGGSLLLTSRDRAEGWQVDLPDLRSRLRLAAPVVLQPPDDELLRQVLVKLFADRQLLVDKPVIDYLVSRMERSLSAAAALVEALDRAALAAGRRITRPMAAEVLAGVSAVPGEFPDQQ
jgi:chromosomal replication initiation ATPase DnaA